MLHVEGSPATFGNISESSSGVIGLGEASGMSGAGGNVAWGLGVIGGGLGRGRSSLGDCKIGMRGRLSTSKLRKHTQGSRLLLYMEEALKVRGCPRQVNVDSGLMLQRASMLHSQALVELKLMKDMFYGGRPKQN